MLEIVDDMLRLIVRERCIVGVCGEMSLASYYLSVVSLWLQVTDA